ncbi:MAG: ribose 5-phosphate isomerase B [Clostridia bacterium]|nr:ribose 5-phosphate isomerase B [Clostridia bacterium]MBR6619439.1 ribose 5-phosphate isomerase B [Clostridia bacterium]
MIIALGADHGGYELKESIKKHLEEKGVEYIDYGSYTGEAIDYPIIAKKVADAIVSGECGRGILCCGTGVGISIAANKVKGIRCACCSDYFSAYYTRLHNDANILAMGGRVVGAGLGIMMADVFLETEFEGGRHERRVGLITEIENEN